MISWPALVLGKVGGWAAITCITCRDPYWNWVFLAGWFGWVGWFGLFGLFGWLGVVLLVWLVCLVWLVWFVWLVCLVCLFDYLVGCLFACLLGWFVGSLLGWFVGSLVVFQVFVHLLSLNWEMIPNWCWAWLAQAPTSRLFLVNNSRSVGDVPFLFHWNIWNPVPCGHVGTGTKSLQALGRYTQSNVSTILFTFRCWFSEQLGVSWSIPQIISGCEWLVTGWWFGTCFFHIYWE